MVWGWALAGIFSGSSPVEGFLISIRYENNVGDCRPSRSASIIIMPVEKSRRLLWHNIWVVRWDIRYTYRILVEIFLGKLSVGRWRKRCDNTGTQSGYPVSEPSFEPGTSLITCSCINHCTAINNQIGEEIYVCVRLYLFVFCWEFHVRLMAYSFPHIKSFLVI